MVVRLLSDILQSGGMLTVDQLNKVEYVRNKLAKEIPANSSLLNITGGSKLCYPLTDAESTRTG